MKKKIKNVKIFSDYTARIPSGIKRDFETRGVVNYDDIDEIIEEASLKTILGKKLGNNLFKEFVVGEFEEEEIEWTEEKEGEILRALTEVVLENLQNKPEKVYIFPDLIFDHAFLDEDEKEKLMDIQSKIFHLEASADEKKYFKEMQQKRVEFIKEKFIQAGVEQDQIVIGPYIERTKKSDLIPWDDDFVKEVDQSNNLIIIDRHPYDGCFKNAKKFHLPSGNFFADV